MRVSLLFAALLITASQGLVPSGAKASDPRHNSSNSAQQSATADQRGTERSPLVVKTLPSSKTQEEIAQETADREQKSSHDKWLVIFSGVLAVVAIFQLIVYGIQSWLLKKTVKSAGEQSAAMERHIGEAARSATAMETIHGVIDRGNRAITRAYLSVTIGAGLYQQRRENVRFEGKPNLVNTGATPARNVKIRIAAAITKRSEAETFEYPLPEAVAKAPAVCAPHQTYILSGMLDDFVPDGDVQDIKEGRGKALTVWGTVTYDDIFGDSHTTKFGQWLFWYPDPKLGLYGFYIPGQNDMD